MTEILYENPPLRETILNQLIEPLLSIGIVVPECVACPAKAATIFQFQPCVPVPPANYVMHLYRRVIGAIATAGEAG